MWFETLTGFAETSLDEVRSKLSVDGERLTSSANGASWRCGTLQTPSLAELQQAAAPLQNRGSIRLREIVGDVQQMHTDPANNGALFQVASQFNLLEMASPSVTPDEGVGIYQNDRSQGPACAIARALDLYQHSSLNVAIVSYGSTNPALPSLLDAYPSN